MGFAPVMESLSVVPVGISDYRDGLFKLEPFDSRDAAEVIDIIEGFQKQAYEKFGTHFVHASDEWYINAGRPMPGAENYDGYTQIENGVGMVRSLCDEFYEALGEIPADDREYTASIVTGVLVYDHIKKLAEELEKKFKNVTGLLTGQDIKKQLQGKELGSRLLLPENTLKCDEEIFLDDMTLDELRDALQVEIYIVKSNGADLVNGAIGGNS